MNGTTGTLAPMSTGIFVAADADRYGQKRGLGISTVDFKTSAQEGTGLFIVELTLHEKGGPGRHLHVDQDEWFYALAGRFVIEVGTDHYELGPGDSVMAPRRVPHVWAYAGGPHGKLLIVFNPAGGMEAFFRETTKANAMPPQDPNLFRTYGMELVGPPLPMA